MISATIARPRPAPEELVPFPRQNRSNTWFRSSGGIPGPRSTMLTLPLAYVLTVTSLPGAVWATAFSRSEEHTSELQSLTNLVCRLLLEKKKKQQHDGNDWS